MHDNLRDLDSEKTILGGLMLDGLRCYEGCVQLRPEHFALTSNAEIFKACVRLFEKGQANGSVSVSQIQAEYGRSLDELGGIAYVAGLISGIPFRWDPSERVALVIEAWKRRRGVELCERYGTTFQATQDAGEAFAGLQSEVLGVMSESTEQDDPEISVWAAAEFDVLMTDSKKGDEGMGLSYGCPQLDKWTNGMRAGEVTVVGARSGVGKSSLMKQATAANCRVGVAVDMFSLEMSRRQIFRGLVAIESGVSYARLVRPILMNDFDRDHAHKAFERIKSWPLRVYDKSSLSIDQICAYARMGVRRKGTKLVCVDYAQNVESDGKDERIKVANVSRKLTKMTKDEGNHLLLLSQLRKVSQEHYSHPPTIADLRETGQLENDAHVVVLLHRGWDADACRVSRDAQLFIPKCRDGETGAMPAKFDGGSLCFV